MFAQCWSWRQSVKVCSKNILNMIWFVYLELSKKRHRKRGKGKNACPLSKSYFKWEKKVCEKKDAVRIRTRKYPLRKWESSNSPQLNMLSLFSWILSKIYLHRFLSNFLSLYCMLLLVNMYKSSSYFSTIPFFTQ